MLNILNPLWLPYQLLVKLPFRLLLFVLFLPLNTWRVTAAAWKKYDKLWQRVCVTAFVVWTAIPGTWLWLFYKTAVWAGYGEEVDAFVSVVSTVASAVWFTAKVVFTTMMNV